MPGRGGLVGSQELCAMLALPAGPLWRPAPDRCNHETSVRDWRQALPASGARGSYVACCVHRVCTRRSCGTSFFCKHLVSLGFGAECATGTADRRRRCCMCSAPFVQWLTAMNKVCQRDCEKNRWSEVGLRHSGVQESTTSRPFLLTNPHTHIEAHGTKDERASARSGGRGLTNTWHCSAANSSKSF